MGTTGSVCSAPGCLESSVVKDPEAATLGSQSLGREVMQVIQMPAVSPKSHLTAHHVGDAALGVQFGW